MTTAPTSVPYSRLVLSEAVNVRRPTSEGIAELAAQIKAKGLLRPLLVRPADGSDKMEITGGGRRYKAIGLLIKAGDWPKKQAIPVIVRNETDADALDTSMMDNSGLAMHPVDQHEAFARLADSGMAVPDIAARYGISDRTVRQQMALGRLAPKVRDAWRKGTIDADTARAFAGSGAGHDAQTEAFGKLLKQGKWALSAHGVRSELARDTQRTSAKNIPQRTLDLYVQRGGTISEDLFETDKYIDDALLLAAVRKEIAAGLADELRTEGWGWVARGEDLGYGWRHWATLGDPEWTDAEIDAWNKLPGGEASDDMQAKLDLAHWTREQKASAGAVIHTAYDGGIEVHRGIIRPTGADTALTEDEAEEATADLDDGAGPDQEFCSACNGEGAFEEGGDCPDCDGTGYVDVEPLPHVTAMTGSKDDEDASGTDPFAISGALMETITTSQTNAAAEVLRHFHDVDLLLRLTLANLKSKPWGRPIKLSATPYQGAGNARGDFVDVLARLNKASTDELLAWLAAELADAMDLRSDDITALIQTLKPDAYLDAIRREFIAADYFKRATKATALAAIDELIEAGCGGGLAPVDVLADMKKADLAEVAALRATAHGWLPPQLRHPAYGLTAVKAEQAA